MTCFTRHLITVIGIGAAITAAGCGSSADFALRHRIVPTVANAMYRIPAASAAPNTPAASFNPAALSGITPGVTTETALVKMFGQPTSRSIAADGSAQLEWSAASFLGTPTTQHPALNGLLVGFANQLGPRLVVTIGQDGTVAGYSVEAESQTPAPATTASRS